jgi:hypothetical protein
MTIHRTICFCLSGSRLKFKRKSPQLLVSVSLVTSVSLFLLSSFAAGGEAWLCHLFG